jgi:hypothetical protein
MERRGERPGEILQTPDASQAQDRRYMSPCQYGLACLEKINLNPDIPFKTAVAAVPFLQAVGDPARGFGTGEMIPGFADLINRYA